MKVQLVGIVPKASPPSQPSLLSGIAPKAFPPLAFQPLLIPILLALGRQEFSDTVAYSIAGPSGGVKLFWCPDIDSWQEWDVDIRWEC